MRACNLKKKKCDREEGKARRRESKDKIRKTRLVPLTRNPILSSP
jgi:hypothetical protein